MIPTRSILLAAAFVAGVASLSHAADPARLVPATRSLSRNAFIENTQALVQARGTLETLSKAEPKSAWLHYWVALADWRLTPRVKDQKQAAGFCSDGIRHADRAIQLNPKFAEAMALKSSLQGLSFRFDASEAMNLGMEMEQTMKRAVDLAPTNPRVLLLDGMNTLHKPPFIGGGPDKAYPKFLRADSLFAASAVADSTAPDWGHEDILIWAGQTAAMLKDTTAARGFYERALRLNPRNGWVRGSLLAALNGHAPAERPGAAQAAPAAALPADSTLGGKP